MSRSEALLKLNQQIDKLREHTLASNPADQIHTASNFYLLAPTSFLGQAFAGSIAHKLLTMGKSVFLVDDTISGISSPIEGCSVIGSGQFSQIHQQAQNTQSSMAINMANTVFAHGFFSNIAARTSIPVVDIIHILDAFEIPVIYQNAQTMRRETLDRLDDYIALANQLDDAFSIRTLGAFLEMRITLDRTAILPVLCSLEDEYFSPYPAGKNLTFELNQNEVFCDVGAHVGTTLYKFLTATRWKYKSIHAFEPDSENFSALKRGIFEKLPDFHPKNIALSNAKSTMSFSETGTMGSRLDANGNVHVHVSTLDDELSHATFIKMDVEGHETQILQGARRLISSSKPRLAITGYHFSNDLLEIAQLIRNIEPKYRFRLRHHSFYYYDTILYADVV